MDENNHDIVFDWKNPSTIKLAHGYFPSQQLKEVCVSVKCFESGTIFPELDMPYVTNPEYAFD